MSLKCTGGCDFCEALTNTGDISKTSEYMGLGDLLPSRTIFDTKHFSVIASLGQIVEGYLLIISKEHYYSMAHITDDLYEELDILYSRTKLLLSNAYGPPIIFEHGPMPIEKEKDVSAIGGGSCVDHAHLHFVPFPVSSTHIISYLRRRFSCRTISNFEELKIQAERNIPYFFVETPKGERYIFDVPFPPPSQYLRQLLSNEIGVPEKWNWRIHPETERILTTVKLLNDYMYGRL
ncbi:MAG: hypothetical protein MPEBLZ_03997 [Candidatus Methanoperedens nitroreducens]|uniref:HIT domain-containing protein n=1 Tax=Candidatus Methanoperedens nitratireducens TaxID=1392998 RepID=A0A0P8CFS5_9EURY|nr:hypothetical protein [Candidatus Methanoperedens sp. BLZ2]KAB2945599.1 MAG: hypothetical protein F9K14_10075 [Candidatus Methanoperedens sp.]KPQ41454.1 MAG: hypothetical protein MPEBLZ_03997 [Candidatus Methanoperedens sp. BLZ1]MBZ0176112.1 hypothetical protein [Candidatus Methanoperedens nitroreducens]MCX9079365.1 hypothetical protein [Candidatus Methanoperedens sp.]